MENILNNIKKLNEDVTNLQNEIKNKKEVIDNEIYSLFLKVNNLNENSIITQKEKTFKKIDVYNCRVRGFYSKINGEISKTPVYINVDSNYKIIK